MAKNLRILVVDDNPAIHADIRKILQPGGEKDRQLEGMRSSLFADARAVTPLSPYQVDVALQGQEGLELVQRAVDAGLPYAVAFVDMRMPPGWNGVETIERLWGVDPNLQVVIATAYADHSWEEIVEILGVTDKLLFLRKPFDSVEILQLASTLTEKWDLALKARLQLEDLERQVRAKTQDLARVNADLQAQVREISRAEELARRSASALADSNRNLERANVAADAANLAKSDFLTNMSHEIRTPMTSILGYTDLLSEPDLTREEIAQHVRTIRRNCEHLLSLINDILDLSKVTAGAMRAEHIPCSPVAILREVSALMGLRAAEKGLELSISSDGLIPETILSDPTRLKQILLNLVANGIKFTERGSVQIRARLLPEEAGRGPWLALDVIDTGIGLSPEQQKKLFQPFSQADTSTTRRFGGSGLGLSISQRLSELLGGTIAVQSTPGAGCTFTATVETGPLAGVRMVEVLVSRQARDGERPAPGSPGPRLFGRVLLAEDGRDNQRLIGLYVTRAGATIEVVDDGIEACEAVLRAMKIGSPHLLVLMDMQMPRMDGYEATRELRRAGYAGPIVALTAHAMPGDRERCLAAGCDDYLSKPIDRKRFLETCRRLLVRGDAVPAPLPKNPAVVSAARAASA